MDVAMARVALTLAGIENSGYLVSHPDAFQETFDRIITPVSLREATLVKSFGADHILGREIMTELVVYVDEQGNPTGETEEKLLAHNSNTKLTLHFRAM
jgi:hypothetical protein